MEYLSNKGIFIALFFVTTFSWWGSAQVSSPKEELLKINAVFTGETVSLEVRYRIYKDSLSHELLEEDSSVMKRRGNHLLLSAPGVVSIVQDSISLLVDEESEMIVLQHNNGNIVSETFKKQFPIYLDSMLLRYQVSTLSKGKYKGLLVSYPAEDEISSMLIWYHPENYYLHKCIIYTNKPSDYYPAANSVKPRIEILYKNLNTQPVGDENFNLSPYIKWDGKGYELQKKYQHFTFYNLLKPVNHEE